MDENNEVHTQFLDTHTRALIDRDAGGIADLSGHPFCIFVA